MEKTKRTAAEQFWAWFLQHERELFRFDPDKETERERIFDQLASELQKVDAHLTFEFGPRATRREFVISAGGIKSAFPAVTTIVNAAPALDRFLVTAFRPRRIPPNIVEFRDKRVDSADVRFSLLDNGKTAGLYLFIPGYQESNADWKQIGYLLLDDTLGEYDVEYRLGLIEMLSPDVRTEGERYPLAKLPALFDELVSRLEGRSEKPS
ncbi:MAG TPA: hypothetical protein VNX88_02095 [Terriglobales bacterium]|nr:hypothetical protein [Terriglobales bacterium]